jgi:hypothetical protein
MKMFIKLSNAPKNYKHLEKLVFEVIGESEKRVKKDLVQNPENGGPMFLEQETITEITTLKVIKIIGSFSLPFETDCRTNRQKKEGHKPIYLGHNPTVYDKKDNGLIGMVLKLNLDLFTVLPA